MCQDYPQAKRWQIIADLSGPSLTWVLDATVPMFEVPFALTIEKKTPVLFGPRPGQISLVLRPVIEFENRAELLDQLLERIVKPAEDYVSKRQRLLSELFNREAT